jgi:hypothetical protein
MIDQTFTGNFSDANKTAFQAGVITDGSQNIQETVITYQNPVDLKIEGLNGAVVDVPNAAITLTKMTTSGYETDIFGQDGKTVLHVIDSDSQGNVTAVDPPSQPTQTSS